MQILGGGEGAWPHAVRKREREKDMIWGKGVEERRLELAVESARER